MNIIEFAGTPKSGKDSINERLGGYFKESGFSVLELKGGISKSPLERKDSIEALIWSMCDLEINYITKRMQTADYMMVNRGVFDRLIWIEQYLRLGTIDEKTARKYTDCWIEFALDRKDTIIFLLITSPDKAMSRDPRIKNGTSGRSIMNLSFLESFNESCIAAYEKYKDFFAHVAIIDERTKEISLDEKVKRIINDIS